MSKKPYIIQEDSPNLIIVPIPSEICYEPSPKKTKLDNNNLINLPVQSSENSALVNNASVKVKPDASSRNNSVLIDVMKVKKQPNSWAANFLQSIGGCPSKQSRSYPYLATKLSLARKENSQPNAVKTATQPKLTSKPAITKKSTQMKSNKEANQAVVTELNQPKPDKGTLPKANQESLQLKLNKELTQLKGNNEVVQRKVNKEPIPLQLHKETIQSTSNRKGSQLKLDKTNQPNKEAIQPKAKKNTLQIKPSEKLTQLKVNKEMVKRKVNEEATSPQPYKETTQTKTNKESSQTKLNKASQPNKEAIQLKTNREGLQIKLNKNLTQPKVYKRIKQKSKKEDAQTLLKLYEHYKEITKQNTKKKVSEPRAEKEATRPQSYTNTTLTNIKRETAQPRATKTIQPNLSTERPKPKANKERSKQINHKKASKDITRTETTKRKKSKEISQIGPIKPPTAALKKNDVDLSLKSFRVSDKNQNPTEPSTSNRINLENSKSLYQEETKGVYPIKSVVSKIIKNELMQNQENLFYTESDNHLQHSENRPCRESGADLRSKLKRKVTRDDIDSDIINIKKFCSMPNCKGFVPNENLIISFNAESDTEQVVENKLPVKSKSLKQSSKGKQFKTLKLNINLIIQQNTDTTDEDDDNTESCNENTDLSFLDDFNIDEIVKSLDDCQSNKAKTATEIYSNNNTIINKNVSMGSGLPTINGKELMHRDDGKKNELSTPKVKILTENNFSNACVDIFPGKYSAVTKYVEDKKSVLQLTNKENSPISQNHAEESDASHLGKINVKNVLPNYKEDHSVNNLVEMSSKELDGKQNIRSNCVELPNEQNNTAVDPIQMHDNSVGLKPKMNVCFNDDIITCTDISPKEVKSSKPSTQLSAENDELNTTTLPRSSQDTENIQPKNNNHDKRVNNTEEKFTILSYDDKTNDASNDKVSECKKHPEAKELSSNAEISQDKGEVILIENDDYTIVKVKSEQYVLQKSIIDLTRTVDESPDTTSKEKEKNIDETLKPNTIEIDTEPNLILKTDSNVVFELESSSGSKEVKNSLKVTPTDVVKTTEPTKNINKISNDVKSTTARSHTQLAKDKNDNVNISAKLVDNKSVVNKEHLTAKQNETKTNTPETKDGKPKTKAVETTNMNAKMQRKEGNNGCQAQSVSNNNVSQSNDTKLSPANKSLSKDVLAQNLEIMLQKCKGKSYSVTKRIQGRFSTVFCCKDKTGGTIAVKVLSTNHFKYGKAKEDMLMKFQKGVSEANLNIIRYSYGFSLTGQYCFVMEYYPGSLHNILTSTKRSFHIDAVQHLSRQLVAAVTILRNNNIIHCDIKPRHILLNGAQTRLKLCGFDEAIYFNNSRLLPNVGTSSYRAPELILGYRADYGIDVWATAAVMYEMATGLKLFPGHFNNDILFKQLCVVADVPNDMLQESVYKNNHYIGNAFSRRVGSLGQEKIIIYEFTRKNWIFDSLFDVYCNRWGKLMPPPKQIEDKKKITMFAKLLYQMFVMHPKYRITIEFVSANPFIS